ncbi:MAG TPA: hypothetical protein VGM81_25385 [Burkholderiaceae bacterium]|jgi:hypothetical protein
MNTTTTNTTATFKVFTATALVALFGAAGLVLTHAEAQQAAAPQIVKLERVVVVGKRVSELAQVEHLPRVVVRGHRANASVEMAQADKRCSDSAVC